MSKQASATISKASEVESNPKSFDLAAYLQARGAIAAVIPAEVNVRTPEQIIKELFALPAPDIRDLYIKAFGDNKPVELTSGASAEDFQFIIRAAYKQVFGNAHLMESERSPEAESQLCSGRISVMEFIRQLAKSDRYRTLFFDRCPNVRFVELNFKHLLGRAPENAAEISEHIKIIAEGGFEAEIDSYLDSDEYFQSFGTIIVPYHRIFATQADNGLVGFTHLFKLLQGACSSDKSNSIDFSPTLQKSLFSNAASNVNWLSTVPKTAPSVSPFEATMGDFVPSEAATTTEPVAEPTTLTIAETRDKEAAAFDAWRGQFDELLDEKFVADAAVATRAREAGKDATAGRRFNPQGFDLASYLTEQEAANPKPVPEVPPEPEIVSKYTNAWRDRPIVEFAQDNSVEDLDLVIEATYKQVFGNAYIMESERVVEAESQLRSGRISIMEFVRQLAQSDHYRTIFFDRCTNLRAIELNFKHLLGRTPANKAEISEHIKIIAGGGFEAEIDSYLDSDEYLQNFGTKIVPYYRGYDSLTASTLAAYTNSFSILRGACSSDKSTLGCTAPILQKSLLGNNASNISDISSVPESAARVSPVGEIEFQSQEYFFPNRLEFPDLNVGIPSYKSSEFLASRVDRSQLDPIRFAYPIPYNEPTKCFKGASDEDISIIIKAAYKQVFGNVHLMESQRLVSSESRLINGQLTVREFIKELANSELYRSLFFNSVPNLRTVELNFKHLLGRAPENAAEISEHIAIIAESGFTAEIDSYLDSDEYQTNFGDDLVPYYIGGKTQTGKSLAGYTRMFELLKGACSSDRSLSATDLQEKPITINYVQEQPVSPEPSGQGNAVGSQPQTKAANHLKAFAGQDPVVLNDNSSLELVIKSAYKQVFGNAHLMESERSPEAESQLIDGRISVSGFIRRLAKSDRYRKLFFEPCSNVRFIELNFKHLLGRAPENAAEIAEHIAIIAGGGYEAEIDSYISSDEYQTNFGNDIVPYYRGFASQTGNNVAGYTHSYQLLRGASTSDRSIAADSKSKLQRFILSGNPSRISALSAVPNAAKGFDPLEAVPLSYVQTTVQVTSSRNDNRCDRSLLAETLLQNQASSIPLIGLLYQATPQKVDQESLDDTDSFNLASYLQEQEDARKAALEVVVETVAPEIASNFTNPFADIKPFEFIAGASSVEDLDAIIANAYRQVFGNAYLMESERLPIAESKLREGSISVREFVRQLATSEHYRRSFFDKFTNLRAIELNFKHLLGRAPQSHQEISEHIQLIAGGGFAAEINSYLDSNEYQNAYGEDIVPYYRGYTSQVGNNLVGYTNSYQLLRGASTSDKATLGGANPRLQSYLLKDNVSPINPLDVVPDYAKEFDPLAVKRPVPSTEEIIAKALGLPYVKPAVAPAFPDILESVTTKKVEPRKKDTLDLITKAVGLPEAKVVDPITTYVKYEAKTSNKAVEAYEQYEILRKENPVEFLPQAISVNYVNAANGKEPVMLNGSSGAATDIVIEAAYKQVFGNVHLMESQRLIEAESQLRNREIDVAEFVSKLAKSELHRSLFFDNCSNLRAVELNFKQLLGRAPQNAQEICEHIEILSEKGYEAEIDSYIYSEEYQNNFGSDIVPYVRGFATQTGSNVAGYTHSYELFRGASTSDRATAVASGARLQTSLLQGNPTQINPLSAVPTSAPSISPFNKVTPSTSTAASNGSGDSSNIVPFVTAAPTAPETVSANHLKAIADNEPVELRNSGFGENVDLVIKAAYKQVFGNVHLMESQRLTEAESQLCNGSINVDEFVAKLAKSELYRELFFNNCSNIRAIELNFKHLLGRSPANSQEISEHIQILANGGFDAEIDSYVYSEEYQENFGSNIVPYFRGFVTQGGQDLAAYTHAYELLRGTSTSDVPNNGSKLQSSLLANNPSEITPLSCFVPEVEPKVEPKATRPEDLPTYVPRYESMAKPVGPKATSWQTQYNVIANASPVEFILGSSDQDKEIVIKALYKQVLGNAYVMESERFLVAESQLKSGNLSVREFVRMLAKSDLYKSRFIDNCPRYRSHELNFKHLLGRAPDSYQETIEHSNILDAKGYEADIDSYIDSNEYQNAFGEDIVPYYRGYKSQTGKSLLGYTNMFKMLPSMSTSDKAGMSANSPRLAKALIYNNAGGSLPAPDINQLIRDALKPKAVSLDNSAEIAELREECEQQSREIESLTSQLKDMEAIAGFAYAGSWKPADSGDTSVVARTPGVCMIPGSVQEWQNRSSDLKEQIDALKGRILERRSVNAIAESRLNKWRTRFF